MLRHSVFSAEIALSFDRTLSNCLEELSSLIAGNKVLGAVLFVDAADGKTYFEQRKRIGEEVRKQGIPIPVNVLAESPQGMLQMEVWMDTTNALLEYPELDGVRYTRVTSQEGTAVWGFGLSSPDEQLALTGQIAYSFEHACRILEHEGLALSDVVRQWNYVPQILQIQTSEGKQLQHYQVFNEVRQEYYGRYDFTGGYPSATGIGTRTGNFDLDFYAIKSGGDIQKTGLSNPLQQDAYNYDQHLLVGDALQGCYKKTPLFERAKMIEKQGERLVFISGTASIIGQETIGIDDIERQTLVTISNMNELIAHLPGASRSPYSYVRAYIRDEADFAAVRVLCEKHFAAVQVLYLQAEVCRDNLLVEIEGSVELPC